MVAAMNINEIPRDPARRWEWIKYQLRIRGSSAAQLARKMKITDRAIRAAKERSYPRVEREIASTLDTLPQVLWPERWNSDGSPLRQRPNRAERYVDETLEDSVYRPVSHRKTTILALTPLTFTNHAGIGASTLLVGIEVASNA